MSNIKWIAVDWGTSNLRIWAMGSNSDVLDEIISNNGMSGLKPDEFEPLLVSLIAPWMSGQRLPIVVCGMVGSRQGWMEAPYETVPTKPASRTVNVKTKDPRLDVRIIAGIQQQDPADVMRGEETQIAGYLNDKPKFTGLLCLPGTHSKWANVVDGEITHFQTVLTGELFDMLSTKSVLRHSMLGWDDQVFSKAVANSFASPETLLTGLFGVRANDLLNKDNTGQSNLSGMIIGTELAALKSLWEDQQTVVIGAGELARLYSIALTNVGGNVALEDVTMVTLSGLKSVYKDLFQ